MPAGDYYHYPQPCPTCGRCPMCGSTIYVPFIPWSANIDESISSDSDSEELCP